MRHALTEQYLYVAQGEHQAPTKHLAPSHLRQEASQKMTHQSLALLHLAYEPNLCIHRVNLL